MTHTTSGIAPGGWLANFPAWVRVDDLVFVSGRMAIDTRHRVLGGGNVEEQTRLAFDHLEAAIEAAGARLEDLVAVISHHTDADQIDQVMQVVAERDLSTSPPAWTPVMTTGAPIVGADVVLSAIAVAGAASKTSVVPDTIAWWRALPVAAGCRKGDLLVVSGQYGSDADGNVNTPGDVAGQTRNALNRVSEICTLLGGTLADVVDVLSFHQDPRGIEPATGVYTNEFFSSRGETALPSWTAVGTPALYRHGMLAQFQAIAQLAPGSGNDVAVVHSDVAPEAEAGSRSLATLSVEVPMSAAHDGPAGQARAAWDALEHELDRLGIGLDCVAAINSFHKDVRDFEIVRDLIVSRCESHPPSWTPAGMTGFRAEHGLHAFQVFAVVPRGST